MNKVISKIIDKVIIVLVILVIFIYSIIVFKIYTSKEEQKSYVSFAEFMEEASKVREFTENIDKYPQLLDLIKMSPELRTFCKDDRDECIAFLKYLNQHPKSSEQEKIFIEHVKKYPQILDLYKTIPELKIYCREHRDDCMGFLRYLNQHSKIAKQVYNSFDVYQAFRELFIKSEWKKEKNENKKVP
jgi:hypothetical protein